MVSCVIFSKLAPQDNVQNTLILTICAWYTNIYRTRVYNKKERFQRLDDIQNALIFYTIFLFVIHLLLQFKTLHKIDIHDRIGLQGENLLMTIGNEQSAVMFIFWSPTNTRQQM